MTKEEHKAKIQAAIQLKLLHRQGLLPLPERAVGATKTLSNLVFRLTYPESPSPDTTQSDSSSFRDKHYNDVSHFWRREEKKKRKRNARRKI